MMVLSLSPDNGNVNSNTSNANFLNVGGNYNNSDNAGLFYANVNVNSTNSNSNNGSRNSLFTLHIFSNIWGNPSGHAPRQNTKCKSKSARWYPCVTAGVGRRVSQTRVIV